MVDLKTTYLSLELKNPLVASASPLSEKISTVQKLEAAGVSAVVMYSLFEEQVLHETQALDRFLALGTESFAEAFSFMPDTSRYKMGPERYVEHLYNVKKAVSIPVIASLNGISAGGWTEYAEKVEQAGADALELNLYSVPTQFETQGCDLEDAYIGLVKEICSRVSIPVAVKLSPFFTSLPNVALRMVLAGADGLVLFNRFYQPDLNLDELEVIPNLELSQSSEMHLPLRWIALLYGRISADLALSTGIHTYQDAIKGVLAGASITMMASALLKKDGISNVPKLLEEMTNWMDEHEYDSVKQMKGSMSQKTVAEPMAYERANYMKVLNSFRYEG